MIDTWYYIAAFAAFSLIRETRLPALLLLTVALINVNAEQLPDSDLYVLYYIISCVANLIACRIILIPALTKQNEIHAFLFIATAIVDATGGLMFWYYIEPDVYNVIGFYVIMTQILFLWRSGNGGITDYIDSTIVSIRARIFI